MKIVSAIIFKNENCLAIIFKNENCPAIIFENCPDPPTCHRPIVCILQGFLQPGRQFWRQFSLNSMGDTSTIIFPNENCPAIIFENCLDPPARHRPIVCILQGVLQPGRQFWRQFWRQFSLMGDTSAIIFQNENCPAIIFGSGHQGLLGHWGRRQFWATILGVNFAHILGCYSGVVQAQTGQQSAREMLPS